MGVRIALAVANTPAFASGFAIAVDIALFIPVLDNPLAIAGDVFPAT